MSRVHIVGGGPAGSTAALAAIHHGAAVELIEKSRFPRHKVCGEFLSPELRAVLEPLGMWDSFCDSGPARIERMVLHFDRKTISAPLPEPAYGLSRFRFDSLLFDAAINRGAVWQRQISSAASPLIVASGRRATASRGNRIFGFKAHFHGPADDAVELFFFRGCYVGLNAVEDGITNVCGLGPESELRKFGFDMDALVDSCEPLRRRLQPLQRAWKWLHAGPLVFRNRLEEASEPDTYPCGDALSFVDPFTGSGLAGALVTGAMAGRCAALGVPAEDYLLACRKALKKPFVVSSVFRAVARHPWAGLLASAISGDWLFRWTRPRTAA